MGVGAGNICGCAGFLPKFLQTCPKKTPLIMGAFFQIKSLQAPFLPKFPLTCPKKTKKT